MKFAEYTMTADMLCVGEVVKWGRYKPSAETLRYSQLVGALRSHFGEMEFHAVGHLQSFKKQYLSYTLKDRHTDKAKLPLKIEFMTDVVGKVYVASPLIEEMKKGFDVNMGAMLSKGFGECRFKFVRLFDVADVETGIGVLNSRIPVRAENEEDLQRFRATGESTPFLRDVFGIQRVKRPVYGYLFYPVNAYTGHYELALFEGSKVEGPEFLILKEEA